MVCINSRKCWASTRPRGRCRLHWRSRKSEKLLFSTRLGLCWWPVSASQQRLNGLKYLIQHRQRLWKVARGDCPCEYRRYLRHPFLEQSQWHFLLRGFALATNLEAKHNTEHLKKGTLERNLISKAIQPLSKRAAYGMSSCFTRTITLLSSASGLVEEKKDLLRSHGPSLLALPDRVGYRTVTNTTGRAVAEARHP